MNNRAAVNYLNIITGALWNYVSQLSSQADIYHIVESVTETYKQPLESYVTYPLYLFSRQRVSELEKLKFDLQAVTSHQQFVRILLSFFESGGWENTSANVLLMSELMKVVYGDEEKNKYITAAAIKIISEKLRERAKQPIIEKMDDAPLSNAAREEVKKLPKINITETAEKIRLLRERFNDSSQYRKPMQSHRDIKDNPALSKIREGVGTLFSGKLPTANGKGTSAEKLQQDKTVHVSMK